MQWRCEPVREEWQERPFTPAREIVYRRAARWRAAARYLIRNAMERRGLIYGWSQRELWSPNANTSVAKLQGSLHCRGQVRWRYKWISPKNAGSLGPVSSAAYSLKARLTRDNTCWKIVLLFIVRACPKPPGLDHLEINGHWLQCTITCRRLSCSH